MTRAGLRAENRRLTRELARSQASGGDHGKTARLLDCVAYRIGR